MTITGEGHERTLILVKPDGVSRGLVGEIVSRFERHGFVIEAIASRHMTPDMVREHYAHLIDRPFFHEITSYMTSGPVIAIVMQAPNAVEVARQIVGATDPAQAAPGTIRGDLATSIRHNLVHASDSKEAAAAEIGRFFLGSSEITTENGTRASDGFVQ